MDTIFHACAGALLANSLGERRRRPLIAAAVIGSLPDMLTGVLYLCGQHNLYKFTHSPIMSGIVCGLLAIINWRIALALPLHILVDAPLHKFSGFYDLIGVPGITWHEGAGWVVWAGLWAVLFVLAALRLRARRATVREPAS
jgi:hypothetical protein